MALNKKYFNLANFVTFMRIICSILILFFPVLSLVFFILYSLSGVSDMIDGLIARKLNTFSNFGSILDTIADFIFFIVCLIKFIYILQIENWLCIWILIIAFIKIFNVILGFLLQKRLVVLHNFLNKVAGLLLFFIPFTIGLIEIKYSIVIVCFVASLSAILEGYYIINKKI